MYRSSNFFHIIPRVAFHIVSLTQNGIQIDDLGPYISASGVVVRRRLQSLQVVVRQESKQLLIDSCNTTRVAVESHLSILQRRIECAQIDALKDHG